MLQQVEPAREDKGKNKVVDVTTIVSSSTSMTSTPEVSKTQWVVKPEVVTQEPTVGKTDYLNKKPQFIEAKPCILWQIGRAHV